MRQEGGGGLLLEDPADLEGVRRGEHDQFILYPGADAPPEMIDRLVAAGGVRRRLNDYWDATSVVLTDPDGWTVVLTSRTWEP